MKYSQLMIGFLLIAIAAAACHNLAGGASQVGILAPGMTNGTNYTCSDTDGGRNYNVKGTACRGPYCATDNCDSSVVLKEYYCSSDYVRSEVYTCPSSCNDGRCITNQTVNQTHLACVNQMCQQVQGGGQNLCANNNDCRTNPDTCYDGDGGHVYGAYSKTWGWHNGSNYTFYDECQGNNTLNERYCQGTQSMTDIHPCGQASSCSHGACVSTQHLACVNLQCVLVNGAGVNQCNVSSDCAVQPPVVNAIGGYTNPDGGIIDFTFDVSDPNNDPITGVELDADGYFFGQDNLTWIIVGTDSAAPWTIRWNTDDFSGIRHFSGTTVIKARARTNADGWGRFTDMYPLLIQNTGNNTNGTG